MVMSAILVSGNVMPTMASEVSVESGVMIGENSVEEQGEVEDTEEELIVEIPESIEEGEVSFDYDPREEDVLIETTPIESNVGEEAVVLEDVEVEEGLPVGSVFEITDEFGNMRQEYTVIGEKEVKLSDYSLFADPEMIVPSTVEYEGVTYRVTTVGAGVEGLWTVTSIKIEEGITTIEHGGFYGLRNCKSIEFPSTLSFCETGFLEGLESISIPESNEYFTLVNGVLYTKDMSKLVLYPMCSGEASFTVPEMVTTIGTGAFCGGSVLKNLVVGDNVTTLESQAISFTTSLETLTVGSGITKMKSGNISGCENLKEVILEGGTFQLTQACLFVNPNLTRLVLNANITGIGPWALYDNPAIESYEANSEYLNSEDGVLYNGYKLLRYPPAKAETLFVVPEHIKTISVAAFSEYTQNLQTLILNPGVELSTMSVENPKSPLDVYFRDRESINIKTSGTIISLSNGGNVYVPTEEAAQFLASKPNAIAGADVTVKTIPVEEFHLKDSHRTMKEGESIELETEMVPYYATEEVVWSSSNEKIAKVDENGVVEALKTGKVDITAKVGELPACTVSVTVEKLYNLEPVKNIQAKAAGKKQVLLTWDENDTADGYLIYGQKNGKYGYVGMTASTTYTDTKALDTDYNFYWVFPYKEKPDGKLYAGPVEKYVYAKGVIPAVKNLKASSSKKGVTLRWEQQAGVDGYLVYGIRSGGSYGYIGMTTKGTTFTDGKASKKAYNFYWVFPYHKDAETGKMIVGGTPKYTYGRAL